MPIYLIDKIKPKNGGTFPMVDAEDVEYKGKRLPEYLTSGGGSGLPEITEADEGKVLKVVSGAWVAAELPQYEGETEVTPSTTEQTLETAGKMVPDNISVNPIKYAEVGNLSGGKTVTIGG